jgi:hypothetical protein
MINGRAGMSEYASLILAKKQLEESRSLYNETVKKLNALADRKKWLNEMVKSCSEEQRAVYTECVKRQRDFNNWKSSVSFIQAICTTAAFQFSRLRGGPNAGFSPEGFLTAEDRQELEKWLGRVKTPEGYRDIFIALRELAKYSPGKVKNVYALTQKIIIEGPFKGRKIK